MDNKITYEEAYNLVTCDNEAAEKFGYWLASIGRNPWDWGDSELGEFFRSIGYDTIF